MAQPASPCALAWPPRPSRTPRATTPWWPTTSRGNTPRRPIRFRQQLGIGLSRIATLRYGENPHQRAAFYRSPGAAADSIASARFAQGKELSFNNIADADTALECVRQFERAACVIVKHANPCGVAVAADPARSL